MSAIFKLQWSFYFIVLKDVPNAVQKDASNNKIVRDKSNKKSVDSSKIMIIMAVVAASSLGVMLLVCLWYQRKSNCINSLLRKCYGNPMKPHLTTASTG